MIYMYIYIYIYTSLSLSLYIYIYIYIYICGRSLGDADRPSWRPLLFVTNRAATAATSHPRLTLCSPLTRRGILGIPTIFDTPMHGMVGITTVFHMSTHGMLRITTLLTTPLVFSYAFLKKIMMFLRNKPTLFRQVKEINPLSFRNKVTLFRQVSGEHNKTQRKGGSERILLL